MLGHVRINDINEALPIVLPMLREHGKAFTADSLANGRKTIEWPGLFVTEYSQPTHCVLFDPVRDANPFFHYLESMWILAGREDVATLAHVLPRIKDFSDDGIKFHGAYGHRLRNHFLVDQLDAAIGMLRASPNTRQCVLSIWDPARDLGQRTKDMPCNDMVMLKIRNGALNITVCNRSNDAIWGCYGANVVQFSMLQMYLAASIGCQVGTYMQLSDSFHVYDDNPYWQWFMERYARLDVAWANGPLYEARNLYYGMDVGNFFEHGIESMDADLSTFWIEAQQSITNGTPVPMFARSVAVRTAISMWNCLYWHRKGNAEQARTEAWNVEPDDWRTAAQMWLARREQRAKEASGTTS